ncbi:MAG: hypothetical protein ACO1G9_00025 [Bacteroidota bacterium]
MARPKTKSALVDGMTELVDSLRSIESKLNMLLKNKNLFGPKRGRGRPPGSVKIHSGKLKVAGRKPGRPAASSKKSSRGPGRPRKSGK